jgi:NAD(P)-dependent dehydrogenase (short-subunit alcohol dehydrogenase family)
MHADWNWLQDLHRHGDGPDVAQAMPVFSGQKLVVVGGSSGMGRQTAADVVAAGGTAVIIGQDPGKVDDTVKTLAMDGKAYGITADLADREQVERVRRELASEHADATLLVNAAGLFVPKPFLDYDGASYDSYLELDRAIFFLTQTVARGMVAHGQGGSIVNIGSMWAHQAIAATPSSGYSVGKAGLHALTRNLAMELAQHRIRVNAVVPAFVATPHLRTLRPQGQARADPAQLRRLPPARPGRHRPRPGKYHHVPALPGHQLGHRRHLGRRRRRDGRTQLTTPDARAPGASGPAHVPPPAYRGTRNCSP